MLHTITALNFINGVSQPKQDENGVTKPGRPYHIIKIEVAERPGDQISGFASSEMMNWKVGDKVDIAIKSDGEYNGVPKFKFAEVDSNDGRIYKIYEFMESMADDIAAIKMTLQITDVPKEKKPRAHQTTTQKEDASVAAANVASKLDDIVVDDLPF